jgi:hypothetical protein
MHEVYLLVLDASLTDLAKSHMHPTPIGHTHQRMLIYTPQPYLPQPFKPKGSNKVGTWKSCHQEREIEHFGKAFVVTCSGDGEKKNSKEAKLLRSQAATCTAIGAYHQPLVNLN